MSRPPTGPKIAARLEGGADAKRRLEVVLETIAGQTSVEEACAKLRLRQARFHVIRNQALEAAVKRLEPQPTGRPPKQPSPEQARVVELEREVARLTRELEVAEIRTETALLLPRMDRPAVKKKRRPSRVLQKRSLRRR